MSTSPQAATAGQIAAVDVRSPGLMRPAPPRRSAGMSFCKRAERRLGWLLCAPAAIVMLAVTGYPILYSVWLSLQRFDLKFPAQRHFTGLTNYVTVLANQYWWTAFWVTAVITVISVAVELVLGMGLALLMHRTLVGRGLVRTSALIPYGIVTVVAAFWWRYAWTPHTGYLANIVTPDGTLLTDQASALAIIRNMQLFDPASGRNLSLTGAAMS